MQKLNREQLLFVYQIDLLSSLQKKDRSAQLKQEQSLSYSPAGHP